MVWRLAASPPSSGRTGRIFIAWGFGRRDHDDEGDPYLGEARKRAALESLIGKGSVAPNALAMLRSGRARNQAEVWRGAGGDFVRLPVS